QVKEEFKKFESIKPGGVQVRNHKSILSTLVLALLSSSHLNPWKLHLSNGSGGEDTSNWGEVDSEMAISGDLKALGSIWAPGEMTL
ncbi:unnamed protein product, partial [Musa hybrid cultivar]